METSKPTETATSRPPLNILVVDDDETLRDCVKVILTDGGHTAETVPNGAAALEKLLSTQFDVLLTDFAMPEMNGAELAAHAKIVSLNMFVIMMSGHASLLWKNNPLHFKQTEVLLAKPFTAQELLRAANESLTSLTPLPIG